MILYHYSVNSYQSGDSLYNDYKNFYQFAEPFFLALQKGEECFWSTYFSAMYYSRELCTLGLRKYENYLKNCHPQERKNPDFHYVDYHNEAFHIMF